LKTLTISIRLAVIAAGVVVALSLVASAQNRTDLRQHYGAAIGEVYRTPSHLMVTAYFDEDGNICREHVESEDRGRRMTNNEVKTVVPTRKSILIERVELVAKRGRVQWNVRTSRFPALLPSPLPSNSGRSAR
jgi:hypothetical protein